MSVMKKYNSGRVINTRLGEQMNLTLKSESLGTLVMFRKKDLLKYIKDESEKELLDWEKSVINRSFQILYQNQ